MAKEKKDKNLFYRNSVLLAFISVLVATGVVTIRYFKVEKGKNVITNKNIAENINQNSNPTPTDADALSREYINKMYGYKVLYNKFLDAREYDDPGEYLHFVKFEENRYSNTKGFAIGVTTRSKDEEKDKIINNFKEEYGVDADSESNIKADKYEGVQLTFSQQDGLEARSIVIIKNGNYTYSISTVPEQIELVLSNLDII